MEDFYERLMARAATIDELLSDAFEPMPGQKIHTDLAARRLAAWCRSSASGDWSQFARRLQRDGLTINEVLARFATARRNESVLAPKWIDDAVWIGEALHRPASAIVGEGAPVADPVAFEELLAPVIRDADTRLWSGIESRTGGNISDGARDALRRSLFVELSDLSAPAIYERFAEARSSDGTTYHQFVTDMKADGFRRLFEDKPVLLRLIASLTRQWMDTSRELITRLGADLPAICRDLLQVGTSYRVVTIGGDLSDPHNFGRTVRLIGLEDGSRVVYKPKDLRVDAAWRSLIVKLNRSAPLDLRSVRVLPRDGYGWTEFVDHTSCFDMQGFRRFFRRAGAWLALFHCFVGVDMHQENIIAAGEHPVPIDLEMILLGTDAPGGFDSPSGSGQAYDAAMQTVINSVLTVGLLPAYGKYSNSKIFAIGGVTSTFTPRIKITWTEMNADAMRPAKSADSITFSNLPFVDDRRGRLGDYLDDFISAFDEYATFLRRQHPDELLDNFAGLTIRKIARPTRFYYMLLQRLRDHRTMEDGIVWSAQADFPARLADWEHDSDPTWPLQRAERAAVLELNVPHFSMASDGHEIHDLAGISIVAAGMPGVDRARERIGSLDEGKIAWQVEIIRQNSGTLTRARPRGLAPSEHTQSGDATTAHAHGVFTSEAGFLAETLSEHAVRNQATAAWIGLDWLGDSEISQLVVLGPDMYNGACGIALFLAAHAAFTNAKPSEALAHAALAGLRQTLAGRNPARMARSLGLGVGLGLGSIVYSLAVISELLDDDAILADAHRAVELITDEVISSDRQLDILGGSAGAILGLLRLYRQTGSDDALKRATACGKHLLTQDRVGPDGSRCWIASAFGHPVNGMAHGAAGYAYALASLASATGSDQFASAADECIAFERTTFDADRENWSDLRGVGGDNLPCKWCYGAPGIGLARAAMMKHAALDGELCRADMSNALAGAERGWPAPTDTLCCGTLGSIEFWWEAGGVLGLSELRERASRRLLAVVETARSAGDYRWTNGTSRFNLGLFRGVSGVGYTTLRRVNPSLPNVLIWE
jgi:type 2 lantibiotic biosynthesis protein LanM